MPYPIPCKDAAKKPLLAAFQEELVGQWENKNLPGSTKGGLKEPLSYNIMPLPEKGNPNGYILKNFKYTERIRFNDCKDKTTLAIGAGAPNRGGLTTQTVKALFYEQQVRYAEGPGGPEHKGGAQVVHVENGSWLYLPIYVQQPGPYPLTPLDAEPVSNALKQPSEITIAKQISVPHGNSVLALGSYETVAERNGAGECHENSLLPGAPVIPDAASPYPRPADPIALGATLGTNLNADAVYSELKDHDDDFQNPHPHLTMCPNAPLQEAAALIKPDHHMHWSVTTLPLPNGQGHVTNIPFEHRRANVTEYYAEYWMLFKGKAKYLAYTQTMVMELIVKDKPYRFPHVTCNVLTYEGLYDPCRDCKEEPPRKEKPRAR